MTETRQEEETTYNSETENERLVRQQSNQRASQDRSSAGQTSIVANQQPLLN